MSKETKITGSDYVQLSIAAHHLKEQGNSPKQILLAVLPKVPKHRAEYIKAMREILTEIEAGL